MRSVPGVLDGLEGVPLREMIRVKAPTSNAVEDIIEQPAHHSQSNIHRQAEREGMESRLAGGQDSSRRENGAYS
jgi:hypothetical protein